MTADTTQGSDRGHVEEFLTGLGADRMPHPGGTLLEHLRRVTDLLEGWGAAEPVRTAGLCHACYGTSGFDHRLLDPTDRATLTVLIGSRAEALVYLYGSCDRAATYPALTGGGPVPFHDRFTGTAGTPSTADFDAFLLISVANEVDVATHNPAVAATHGAALFGLFSRYRDRLPAAAWTGVLDAFGEHAEVRIDSIDHLVLTVADIDRTIDFYRRALNLEPLTFGAGRRALAFGPHKINLHQAGSEFAPHSGHPVPGSADLCLVTATPLDRVRAHLDSVGVAVEEGPVGRTGARGPITSLYLRDPDRNLIEISTYDLPR